MAKGWSNRSTQAQREAHALRNAVEKERDVKGRKEREKEKQVAALKVARLRELRLAKEATEKTATPAKRKA